MLRLACSVPVVQGSTFVSLPCSGNHVLHVICVLHALRHSAQDAPLCYPMQSCGARHECTLTLEVKLRTLLWSVVR